jgi:hypothetical protein
MDSLVRAKDRISSKTQSEKFAEGEKIKKINQKGTQKSPF